MEDVNWEERTVTMRTGTRGATKGKERKGDLFGGIIINKEKCRTFTAKLEDLRGGNKKTKC